MRASWLGAIALLVCAHARAEWRYEEIKDDFDGKTSYLLQVDSSIAVQGTDGAQHYPFMQIRCDEDGGQPYVRVHWFAIVDTTVSSNSILGIIENTSMQVRVDGKADNRPVWQMPRDETLEGMATYRAPPLVKTLTGAKELKLRVAGHLGKTHDATFDVAGLEAALAQLRAHCKRL